jgi:uncharacterized protein YicC (UPF0701 family)
MFPERKSCGSKQTDTLVSMEVTAIRTSLEQIREQAGNIE